MNLDLAELGDAFAYAISEGKLTPEQWNSIRWLGASLTPEQKQGFTERWRAKSSSAVITSADKIIQLKVPYFSQRDSATDQRLRMCFSSTCAMAAEYMRPGRLKGSGGQPDDNYLKMLKGDTTEAASHVNALRTLGIKAIFRQDGTIESVARKLVQKIPVPVGWLHKGHVSAPSGGGHWSLVVGYDRSTRQLIVHDPFGEADLVNGGYLNSSGQYQRYSYVNFAKRWEVNSNGSFSPGMGWWLDLSLV